MGPSTGTRSNLGSLEPRPDIEAIGEIVFTRYLLAFEVTSVLLIIAVVGAVMLARRSPVSDEIPVTIARDDGADPRPPVRPGRRGDVVMLAAVEPSWYLVLAAGLFAIGAVGLLIRRNPLVMFMCVELMLNAVTLTFVTFARILDDIGGQAVVFFVLVVAAAEVVVGLGIIVAILRKRPSPRPTT